MGRFPANSLDLRREAPNGDLAAALLSSRLRAHRPFLCPFRPTLNDLSFAYALSFMPDSHAQWALLIEGSPHWTPPPCCARFSSRRHMDRYYEHSCVDARHGLVATQKASYIRGSPPHSPLILFLVPQSLRRALPFPSFLTQCFFTL